MRRGIYACPVVGPYIYYRRKTPAVANREKNFLKSVVFFTASGVKMENTPAGGLRCKLEFRPA